MNSMISNTLIFKRTDELKNLIHPNFISPAISNSTPIPTNEWWGNVLAWDGHKESDAIFSNPYTYKIVKGQAGSIGCGISMSYLHYYRVDGPINDNQAPKYYFYPPTIKNLLFSAAEWNQQSQLNTKSALPEFVINSWDDLGFTVSLTSDKGALCSYLALGNAFTTVKYENLHVQLRSDHCWLQVNGQSCVKGNTYHGTNGNSFIFNLNNSQQWIVFFYPSDEKGVTLTFDGTSFTTSYVFAGMVQAAYIATDGQDDQQNKSKVVDLYRKCAGLYPTHADTFQKNDQTFGFNWTIGSCINSSNRQFLHLALPHLEVMADSSVMKKDTFLSLVAHTRGRMAAFTIPMSASQPLWLFHTPSHLNDAIDGNMDFYPNSSGQLSVDSINENHLCQIVTEEITADWNRWLANAHGYYFKGKCLQKIGTICLVAKKLATTTHPELISLVTAAIDKFRHIMIDVAQNKGEYPLVYDTVYKGIITSEALTKHDYNVDFGNAAYNDHHFHYGYWINATAMLLYLDPKFRDSNSASLNLLKQFTDTLVQDIATTTHATNALIDSKMRFPRFRNFSWYLGHSYAHGVTPMADGKDQESTSEEVNCFYGLAMYGLMTRESNPDLTMIGKLLLRVNILAINTYFLLADDNTTHPSPQFKRNKVTGIFFDNKCDYATWFSPNKECIHGIQMIPVFPMTNIFRHPVFVKQEWNEILCKLPIVKEWKDHQSGWTSLLFCNYSVIDKGIACKVLATCPMDDGLSRAWALYFALSQGN